MLNIIRLFKKSFLKYFPGISIIGGCYLDESYDFDGYELAMGDDLDDIEVVSIKKDSISIINTTIPSLPKGLRMLRGTQLLNQDLLVLGGYDENDVENDEYLRFDQSSSQWKKIGTRKMATVSHSSVLLNGCLYSCGGYYPSDKITSHHEVLNLNGRVEEKKELPIALADHTANKLNEYQYMVIGGHDETYVSKEFWIIKNR